MAQESEIRTLDPAIDYDIYTWPYERLLYETLVSYDEGVNLVPRLATAMPQISADKRTFTFDIRTGVNFVNADGSVLREVDANDFAYSLERILNPKLMPNSPVATNFFAEIAGADAVLNGQSENASGIVVVDSHTLQITLTDPDPAFLNILAMPFGSVVPHEFAGTDTAAFSQSPVGTGPYLLASWTPGQMARFVQNPHYWNTAIGHASEVDVSLGVDPETQLQQVEAGTLDVMTDAIPSGEYTSTVNDPRWSLYVHTSPEIVTNFLAMDTQSDGPLSDVRVRQAISYAIDRDNIVLVKNGRAQPGTCIYPPLLPGYNPDCNPYPYNVETAHQMLADAQLPDGFTTSLYTDQVDLAVAQALQQDLATVGITANLVPQESSALFDSITHHDTPLVYTGWVMDFPDPSDFITPILTCSSLGGFNPAWYCNHEVDRVAKDASKETDPAKRLGLFDQIDQMIMDDAPWVPTDYPVAVAFVSPRVQDFALHPVWRFDYERYSVAP